MIPTDGQSDPVEPPEFDVGKARTMLLVVAAGPQRLFGCPAPC